MGKQSQCVSMNLLFTGKLYKPLCLYLVIAGKRIFAHLHADFDIILKQYVCTVQLNFSALLWPACQKRPRPKTPGPLSTKDCFLFRFLTLQFTLYTLLKNSQVSYIVQLSKFPSQNMDY